MTLAERLAATWYAPRVTALAALLWPLSLPYRAATAARRALFATGILRPQTLPVPVVVIGNLNVGGVGKTPLTRALAEALAQRGHRPGIVSRGYGGSNSLPRAVAPDDDPAVVGDEPPIHVESGFPVWIAHARADAARGLVDAHPECDVIISDDGLQHYALARAMEIAVVDASREFGNGLMLPAGPLREPVSRLRDVDAVVRLVAREPAEPSPPSDGVRHFLMTHRPLPWRNLRRPELEADPASWQGREVHAVSGIGNPQRFFDMVAALGIGASCHAFPDHHVFAAEEIAFPGASAILMTQKDAVKCAGIADERCWYLPLRAIIDPALVALVEEKIHGFKAA
ncbi:MAG TPA: tetraacyldisaccharide 4'-kinase [Casimicrobiaceae bacterium]|nr:tetraacyldisaccharide 4'-kinase [Casimicrobiaceae bacterium]